MTTQIKICGLSTPEAIDAAVDAGATHIGFVHYEKSPRHVPLDAIPALRSRVPDTVKLVMVMVAMQPEELVNTYQVMRPDVLQFHGNEVPQYIKVVREQLKTEAWRSVGLREKATLERSRKFEGHCDRLLFDAPAAQLPGGNGTSFQWDLLDGWEPFMPWALAGGLDPDNVGTAIAKTGAPLVDASSGLESAPGVKDIGRIRAFCEAVRAADG